MLTSIIQQSRLLLLSYVLPLFSLAPPPPPQFCQTCLRLHSQITFLLPCNTALYEMYCGDIYCGESNLVAIGSRSCFNAQVDGFPAVFCASYSSLRAALRCPTLFCLSAVFSFMWGQSFPVTTDFMSDTGTAEKKGKNRKTFASLPRVCSVTQIHAYPPENVKMFSFTRQGLNLLAPHPPQLQGANPCLQKPLPSPRRSLTHSCPSIHHATTNRSQKVRPSPAPHMAGP